MAAVQIVVLVVSLSAFVAVAFLALRARLQLSRACELRERAERDLATSREREKTLKALQTASDAAHSMTQSLDSMGHGLGRLGHEPIGGVYHVRRPFSLESGIELADLIGVEEMRLYTITSHTPIELTPSDIIRLQNEVSSHRLIRLNVSIEPSAVPNVQARLDQATRVMNQAMERALQNTNEALNQFHFGVAEWQHIVTTTEDGGEPRTFVNGREAPRAGSYAATRRFMLLDDDARAWQLEVGNIVHYDGIRAVINGQSTSMPALRGVIRAGWLRPVGDASERARPAPEPEPPQPKPEPESKEPPRTATQRLLDDDMWKD